MTQKTVLNDAHRRLGAKMVDFGGWDMPLHYGSQLEEHLAVRSDCGMFDVSHMCAVDVTGADAQAFLRRLLANNVDKLKLPGKALYSAMLNTRGGVVDDLIVYFLGEANYRVVINAGTADKDLAWMAARAGEWQMAVGIQARRDLAIIAVQGPNARAHVWQALPETRVASESLKPFFAVTVGELFVASTGYTGEDGFEITLPGERAEALWQALLDSGLAWTVDLVAERDFVGKSALLAQPMQRQFLGLLLIDRGVLRAHQKVVCQAGEGEITSGTFSPTLQQSIALARLPLGVALGDTVEVQVRDKLLKARVVKPCFVRNGKAMV